MNNVEVIPVKTEYSATKNNFTVMETTVPPIMVHWLNAESGYKSISDSEDNAAMQTTNKLRNKV